MDTFVEGSAGVPPALAFLEMRARVGIKVDVSFLHLRDPNIRKANLLSFWSFMVTIDELHTGLF